MERLRSGELADDWIVEAALGRQFLIIGEAVKLLPHHITDLAPTVHWSGWARLRDVLIHTYWRTDRERMFEFATTEVPALLTVIEGLLAQLTDANEPFQP